MLNKAQAIFWYGRRRSTEELGYFLLFVARHLLRFHRKVLVDTPFP